MQQIKLINFGNVSEDDVVNYKTRETVRAVVFDNNNLVSLLHATKYNYYKLPGGGIETGEDHITALRRECLEEIGSNIEIMGEIGIIMEYRSQHSLKQISYCYIAKLVGEKGEPRLTDSEIEEGFIPAWVTFVEAKQRLVESNRGNYDGNYMVTRELAIINEASKILSSLVF